VFFRLKDLLYEMDFWNETSGTWETIYTGARNKWTDELANNSQQFHMAFYPYEGNSTLLCYTLQQGLGGLGSKFRILPNSFGSGLLTISTLINFYRVCLQEQAVTVYSTV